MINDRVKQNGKEFDSLLVILGASKKTVNSICCLLTEEWQKELTEKQNEKELTEDTIHEMALKVAGITK